MNPSPHNHMKPDNQASAAQDAVSPLVYANAGVVYVVDDDVSVRKLVAAQLASEGIRVEQCQSAEQFLTTASPDGRGCVLLDVDMPGMTGIDLQAELTRRNISMPVVFLTGVADVDTTVRVMKRGAFDLIQKPFRKDRLLQVVREAIALDERRSLVRKRCDVARARYETLNPRERDVLELVVSGMANKQVARQLDLSEKTIEVHRARVMAKMGADSLADLVRSALDAGIGPGAHDPAARPAP